MVPVGNAVMEQELFEQADMLQRSANSRMHANHYEGNSTGAAISTYDPTESEYIVGGRYERGYERGQDGFVHQPVRLDSFDEHLLRQPDYNSRQGQAAIGRARLSLPPWSTQTGTQSGGYRPPIPQMRYEPIDPQRYDLSQFAYDSGHSGQPSSPMLHSQTPSSPAFNASQRRTAPQYGSLNSAQPAVYHSFSADEVEAEEREMQTANGAAVEHIQPDYEERRPPRANHARAGPPVVQGISLVSTQSLPDRFRAIFPYPLFNAVQSKTFDTIYKTNNNFVLCAPTGSGKTAVLELAICRLMNGYTSGSYKIVYQAPTRALCAERQRDWQAKFAPLDLQCAELTGDTNNAQLRNVEHATIIITTPEKWDSMTRKWTDHEKLMQMVKLFLIDEVHMLKEDRGATLEAVVSRMKSIGSDVRFVALSATVPNSQDISTWLGRDSVSPHLPASREKFGEEFRPVKLQKHICGYQANSNDYAFEKTLSGKLPGIISKWSQRKPIMIFCFTRNSCAETAKLLASWWAASSPGERFWSPPRKQIVVVEKDLRDTVSSGVAYHHAGLSIEDRNSVEKGYLNGDINVICCTSTLAVGVNLPCHMIIIKNTVSVQSGTVGGCKEYSDLEIMQMLGRAGRPQFDDSAVAVIMTRLQRVQYYEKMTTGREILESCLHRNLIDHLNAEIALGTITNASSAKKWLSGTFLYVRLKDNPTHYKIDGDAPSHSLDKRLENICGKGIALLEENELVKFSPELQCTEFGDAMARYYIQFETMKVFLALSPKSKISEILSAISKAAEFKDIRFRGGEKSTYKDLNKSGSIKFPIPVNLDAPAHKVSLIIQSVLGAVELPSEDYKQRTEYGTAKSLIFQHVHRLIRCIIDCQLHLEDAVTTRNALMLARSLGAQVWDDSPLHMKQLDGIGIVSVRKLVAADVQSVEGLENVEAHQIERILSRNPPYGTQLIEQVRAFPKLRVSIKKMGEPVIRKSEHVNIKLKAEIGFLNEKVPETFQRKAIYVCLLAETSDGHKVHFARISAKKLNKSQDVLFSAKLTSASQTIRAYIMCDGIAGTMRYASLKPEIPPIAFPAATSALTAPSHSKRCAPAEKGTNVGDNMSDEFDENIDDADLVQAEVSGFVDIDDFDDTGIERDQPKQKKRKISKIAESNESWEPHQLHNGKWACNHRCGDKTNCKHLCCREGLDKKPKPPKGKENTQHEESGPGPKQTQLKMGLSKTAGKPATAVFPTRKPPASGGRQTKDSKETHSLNRLHERIKTAIPSIPTFAQSRAKSEAGAGQGRGRKAGLTFLEAAREFEEEENSTIYGSEGWSSGDLPSISGLQSTQPASWISPPRCLTNANEAEEEMLDAWDVDMEDAQRAQSSAENQVEDCFDMRPGTQRHTDAFFGDFGRQSTPPKPKPSFNEGRFSTDSFLAEVAETTATEAEPADAGATGPDELETWFKANFGTELFNYTG